MADFQKNHPLNTPGSLFTDTTCIDCGTCFHIGIEIFKENQIDDKSIVAKHNLKARRNGRSLNGQFIVSY